MKVMTIKHDDLSAQKRVGIHAHGFSLIELLVVIILLSIISVALVGMFGQLAGKVDINHDINAAAQMAQECGEYLLAQRRENGFTMGGVTNCSALSSFNSNAPATVSVTDPYSGAGCPATASCKLFNVAAAYDSGAASLDIVVVDY